MHTKSTSQTPPPTATPTAYQNTCQAPPPIATPTATATPIAHQSTSQATPPTSTPTAQRSTSQGSPPTATPTATATPIAHQSTSQTPPASATPTTHQSTSQALSTHTFYPRIENDASGRRKKRSGETYPCEVTSEKWRQMYKEKEDAKERERIMRNASNGKSMRRSEN